MLLIFRARHNLDRDSAVYQWWARHLILQLYNLVDHVILRRL